MNDLPFPGFSQRRCQHPFGIREAAISLTRWWLQCHHPVGCDSVRAAKDAREFSRAVYLANLAVNETSQLITGGKLFDGMKLDFFVCREKFFQ